MSSERTDSTHAISVPWPRQVRPSNVCAETGNPVGSEIPLIDED